MWRRASAANGEIERSPVALRRAVADGDERVEPDYQFRLALSTATRNDYFRSFIEYLDRHIIARRSIHINAQNKAVQRTYHAKGLTEYEAIFKAIEAGSPRAARLAMRKHLRGGRDRRVQPVEAAA